METAFSAVVAGSLGWKHQVKGQRATPPVVVIVGVVMVEVPLGSFKKQLQPLGHGVVQLPLLLLLLVLLSFPSFRSRQWSGTSTGPGGAPVALSLLLRMLSIASIPSPPPDARQRSGRSRAVSSCTAAPKFRAQHTLPPAVHLLRPAASHRARPLLRGVRTTPHLCLNQRPTSIDNRISRSATRRTGAPSAMEGRNAARIGACFPSL